MAGRTVLMMVLPSLLVFGLLALALGVKHGEYRAGGGRKPVATGPRLAATPIATGPTRPRSPRPLSV